MSQFDAGPDAARWRRLAIGLGVLAVLAVVVLLVVTLTGDDDPVASPTVEPTSEEVRTSADTQIPTRADTQTPTEPASTSEVPVPDDITFVELLGIELPVSESDGPANLGDGLASGFTRTDRGAALAAIHIASRSSSTVGPDIYGPTIDSQATGSNAEQFRTFTDAQYNQERRRLGVESGEPIFEDCSESEGGCTSVLGYYTSRSDDDEVVSHVLLEALDAPPGQPRLIGFRLTTRWTDGDWKLVAPPGGDLASVVSVIDDDEIDEYLPFREEP